ncbi:hypothetical protein PspLS_02796 [Pyricularia sp. CBS 133598]|nr:hypothetical protein PspLS_02796 [Pyricularia sp. CBS 133598]
MSTVKSAQGKVQLRGRTRPQDLKITRTKMLAACQIGDGFNAQRGQERKKADLRETTIPTKVSCRTNDRPSESKAGRLCRVASLAKRTLSVH